MLCNALLTNGIIRSKKCSSVNVNYVGRLKIPAKSEPNGRIAALKYGHLVYIIEIQGPTTEK